jgi:hypothetical protein
MVVPAAPDWTGVATPVATPDETRDAESRCAGDTHPEAARRMNERVCGRCGTEGTVRRTSTAVNHGARVVHGGERVLCRSCEREQGVPIPPDDQRPPPSEPDPPSWDQVVEHLRASEGALQDAPELRVTILTMARTLRRYARQAPGEMPPEVAAGFVRFGVDHA